MAVVIRLRRQGARNRPMYHVVALDSSKKRQGAYLELLGRYYPKAQDTKGKFQFNVEKIRYWISKGANCSQIVGQGLKALAK